MSLENKDKDLYNEQKTIEIKEQQQKKEEEERLKEEKEAKEKTICPECGMQNPDGVKFCQECGSRLGVSTKIFCTQCGAENPPGTKFCGECGSRIQ